MTDSELVQKREGKERKASQKSIITGWKHRACKDKSAILKAIDYLYLFITTTEKNLTKMHQSCKIFPYLFLESTVYLTLD